MLRLITNERSERSSYNQSYMGRLVDIQTALKPLKKWDKIEIYFYDHYMIGLFKKMILK